MSNSTPARRRTRDRSGYLEAAAQAMKNFARTPRTEEALSVRFQNLRSEDLRALKRYYNQYDVAHLFRRICRFWGIGGCRATNARDWRLRDRVDDPPASL